MPDLAQLVPIRTVCARFGLNPNTLRTWERRYGVIEPRRSEGGHRAYGAGDMTRIEQMVHLMKQGKSPAEAAEQVLQKSARITSTARHNLQEYRQSFRQAVDQLQFGAAMDAAHKLRSVIGYASAVEEVLFPELRAIGDCWQTATNGIAQEHFASLVVRSFLVDQQRRVLAKASGRVAVLACAPGEAHEFPILHVSNLVCESAAVQPLLFVAGLPLQEILQCASRADAFTIVLSATMAPQSSELRDWVQQLRQNGWEQNTILAGGGFNRSRIFSDSKVRSAPGCYSQLVTLLEHLAAEVTDSAA